MLEMVILIDTVPVSLCACVQGWRHVNAREIIFTAYTYISVKQVDMEKNGAVDDIDEGLYSRQL